MAVHCNLRNQNYQGAVSLILSSLTFLHEDTKVREYNHISNHILADGHDLLGPGLAECKVLLSSFLNSGIKLLKMIRHLCP